MELIVGKNSYISIQDADEYFSGRLYSEIWTSSNEALKTQALLMASRNMDKLRYKGKRVDINQKLSFPRYIYKPAGPDEYVNNLERNQYPVTKIEITDKIKEAQCEEALALLEGIPKRLKLQHQGVKSIRVGSLSEEYSGKKVKLLSEEALDLLKPYLIGSVRIT